MWPGTLACRADGDAVPDRGCTGWDVGREQSRPFASQMPRHDSGEPGGGLGRVHATRLAPKALARH